MVSRVAELWRDLGARGRALGIAGLSTLVVLGPLVALGPFVRGRVTERAAARGLSADVGSVRLGMRGVWLRDVAVSSTAPFRVRAKLHAVLVPYGGGAIQAHGGYVELRGTPSEVLDAVRARGATGGERRSSSRTLIGDGVAVSWTGIAEGAEPQRLWGVRVEHSAKRELVRVDHAELALRRARALVDELEVVFSAPERKLASLRASSLVLSVTLEQRAPSDAPRTIGAPSGSQVQAPVASASHWSGRLAALRAILDRAVVDGMKLEIARFSADLAYGHERLGFGPSRLTLGRAGNELAAAVKPAESPVAGTTPLALRAQLPLANGEPSLEIEGGPVSLGALGIRDGELGLVRVRDASLEAHLRLTLASGGAALRGSGSGRFTNLSLSRPELSREPLEGIRMSFRGAGEARLDGSRLAIDDFELSLGDVRVAASLGFERDGEGTRLHSRGGVPLASCGAMLGSLPSGLVGDVDGLGMQGTFALGYDVEFDTKKPDAMRVALDVKNDCRVDKVPAGLSPERFRAPWTREVKDAGGQTVLVQSGPGTPGWTSYDDISKFMETAVLVCEDGGFFRHRGLDFRAIERAVKDDVRARRFQRGASTISMQLAKNLYLNREKTLARKIQEAFLTLLLEQELPKRDIMELYLNVVELGPGIYGVAAAAEHYFKTTPKLLTLGQALYLASILPDPTRQHFTAEGSVTERWTGYLRKLMYIARKIERISDDELEMGLAEEVAFRRPGLEEARAVDADSEENGDSGGPP